MGINGKSDRKRVTRAGIFPRPTYEQRQPFGLPKEYKIRGTNAHSLALALLSLLNQSHTRAKSERLATREEASSKGCIGGCVAASSPS